MKGRLVLVGFHDNYLNSVSYESTVCIANGYSHARRLTEHHCSGLGRPLVTSRVTVKMDSTVVLVRSTEHHCSGLGRQTVSHIKGHCQDGQYCSICQINRTSLQWARQANSHIKDQYVVLKPVGSLSS